MTFSCDYNLACQSISGGRSFAEILFGEIRDHSPGSKESLLRGCSLHKVWYVAFVGEVPFYLLLNNLKFKILGWGYYFLGVYIYCFLLFSWGHWFEQHRNIFWYRVDPNMKPFILNILSVWQRERLKSVYYVSPSPSPPSKKKKEIEIEKKRLYLSPSLIAF